MIVQSSFKQYQVVFEENYTTISKWFGKPDVFYVIDQNVYHIYQENIFEGLYPEQYMIIESIEENKNIQTVLDICEKMTKLSAKRNIHLVSIGGGIIQDITGLVANILYRGIKWTFIPTTLLAACDSCIGGKTSLNYKNFKNLLGTFYPPDQIIIFPDILKSLTERDYQSGLGEVVKFNIMYGMEGLVRIENDIDALLNRQSAVVEKYIRSSLEFKKRYIEEDEFDRGIRICLNFAHTFGHAIESVTSYAIPHGTAVAMGTIVANYISMLRGYLSNDIVNRIENVMLKIIHIQYDFEKINMNDIVLAIKKDKKQTDDGIRAVLFDENMTLSIYQDVLEEEIAKGFQRLQSLLN